MVERILIGMSRAGAWSNLPADDCRVGCNCDEKLYRVVATSPAHVDLARRIAARGVVMLKNSPLTDAEDSPRVLPLQAGQKIALLGGACAWKPDPEQELKTWTEASYYSIGGTSRVLSPHIVTLEDALKAEGANLILSTNDFTDRARQALAGADVAVVCGGATGTESSDRASLRLDQDAFIGQVVLAAKQMKVPVVVVAFAPGAVQMPWRTDVTGLLCMFPSGQTTGAAAADVLLGRVNPSGKLPVTIPLKEEPVVPLCAEEDCSYQEGLFGGWHVYDGQNVAFPFGYGLSFTQFQYKPGKMSDAAESASRSRSCTVTVKNVGNTAGSDIVQLYLRFPSTLPAIKKEPATILRHFQRTRELQPGEEQDLVFLIRPRDEMIWDDGISSWTMVYGDFTVGIGASSRELRLCGDYNNQRGVTKTDAVRLDDCQTRLFLPAADIVN
mmetsp:Transcript_37405/g.83524  ORF Transcript_37405/g.83524 Transcript_37405/m.83524 type:complete len:442 (+) Transcript_37405:2-1327(+)